MIRKDDARTPAVRAMAPLLASARSNITVIFQISQILKIGKQSISIQISGKYYADTPRYGPK